jgi:hypothetical protein
MNTGNGNTVSSTLTVPSMPTSCGLGSFNCATQPTGSSTNDNYNPAFLLKSAKAHPDDKTDVIPVTFQYLTYSGYVANGNSCSYNSANATLWTDPTPKLASGPVAAKCIRATGFAVPDKHFARLSYQFQLRLDGTDNWPTSPDAKIYFRAGFSFASATTVTFATPASSSTSNLSFGISGAGQKVTALGGFAYDQSQNGIPGQYVRVFNSPPPTATGTTSGTCGPFATSGAVAQDTTAGDGFWFIWRRGSDQNSSSAALLPSGVQYTVVLCGPLSGMENARYTLSNKLGNNEFQEIDFHLITATQFTVHSSTAASAKKLSKATRRALHLAALRRLQRYRR